MLPAGASERFLIESLIFGCGVTIAVAYFVLPPVAFVLAFITGLLVPIGGCDARPKFALGAS